MKEKLQDQRVDYQIGSMELDSLNPNPLLQFTKWYQEYESLSPKDPNAFILSTVDYKGQPHSRVLLLKGVDQGGFEFYTNYESDKGRQLAQNPQASLCFFWPEAERQIRVEGKVIKLTEAESEAYFKSRPHGSQVGAWVSPQSRSINSRVFLEERARAYATKYESEVPKPPHWGGYRLMPERIELWQGRASRLHDRALYQLKEENWSIERLAP